MPRYLFNPTTGFTSDGDILPIVLGGTGAASASVAITNLAVVPTSSRGVANGVCDLDSNTKIPIARFKTGANGVITLGSDGKVSGSQLPSGLGLGVSGPVNLYVGQTTTFKILGYSAFSNYTITAVGGTVSRVDDTITFTVTGNAGTTASIDCNGGVYSTTILAAGVKKPVINTPTDGTIRSPLYRNFNSDAFGYYGAAQTQDTVRWEISTAENFGTLFTSYEGASNLTSWNNIGTFAVGTRYYVRVKKHSTVGGWSEWSDRVMFDTTAGQGWATYIRASTPTTKSHGIANLICDPSGNLIGSGASNDGTTYSFAELWKFSPTGTVTWAKKLGTGAGGNESFNGVACDTSGNIYVVGNQRSGVPVDKPLIAKYDTSGNLTWQKYVDVSVGWVFSYVVYSSDGYLYAAGTEGSTIGHVIKFDTNGNIVWQKSIATSNTITSMTVDTSNNIYITYGTSAAYSYNIVKINSAGSVVWGRTLTFPTGSSGFEDITTDAAGNVYGISSYWNGYIRTGVMKLDSTGSIVWQKYFIVGVSYADQPGGISVDLSGNIFLAIGGSGVSPIVFEIDPTFTNCIRYVGTSTPSNGYFSEIEIDSSGNAYVVGYANDGTNHNNLIYKLPYDQNKEQTSGYFSGTSMTGYYLSYTDPYTLNPQTQTTISSSVTPTLTTTSLLTVTSTLTAGTATYTRLFSQF